jgi:hypothetical protein
MAKAGLARVGDVKCPAVLEKRVDLQRWVDSLVTGAEYRDPDPDYLSRKILANTLTATTLDEVFAENSVKKLQDWIPNAPGAYQGPLEIDEIYVTGSDFGEGLPCYMIFEGTDLTDDTRFVCSTGVSGLQGQFVALINIGEWPIRCIIKRMESKDKGGRHLLRAWPPD